MTKQEEIIRGIVMGIIILGAILLIYVWEVF